MPRWCGSYRGCAYPAAHNSGRQSVAASSQASVGQSFLTCLFTVNVQSFVMLNAAGGVNLQVAIAISFKFGDSVLDVRFC